MSTSISDRLLAEQVRLVLRSGRATDWTVRADGFWCHARPPDHRPPEQGWKLHVSATPLSAVLVTLRCAEVLVDAGCAFKVAAGLPQVHQLVSVNADRRSSGKVITAYPRDDEQFAVLAEALHRATEHLPGPAILSDRPYRPGSLVHYRYGAFTGRSVLNNDGSFDSMLVTPDGGLVKEERLPRFSPPEWAGCPAAVGAAQAPRSPGPVLLADRFAVRRAIRHGNKGGVYLATDQTTGHEVVIKEARPHVGALLDGTDARDRLRHEAALLERLAPYGLTPRPVTLFEQQGHLFLVEERIEGDTLVAHVRERIGTLETAPSVAMARQILALIGTIHGQGLVVRDLSPANLMVTPQGALKLVDLEFMAVPDTPAPIIGTPGYAAPEQTGADGSFTAIAPVPGPPADLYSLGALLFFLTSGINPTLLPDLPPARSIPERLAHLVQAAARTVPATRALAPAILGLIQANPAQRWSLDRVGRYLSVVSKEPRFVPVPLGSDRLPRPTQDTLLADGLAWLTENMEPAATDRLWPAGAQNANNDPCNVQHGAAGVVAVLARASVVLGEPGLADVAHTASRWLVDRLAGRDRLLPGLYFGTSGTLWSLHDTARLVGDGELAARTLGLARTVPGLWPNPDVCHGAAGAGLAQLHLWRASGDKSFAARVRQCADGLLEAVMWRDGGVCWPIPRDFDSALAGLTHYGFAHGIAGVGAFLLAAGQATGDERCLRMAVAAGRTLADAACRDGERAWWPTGQEPDPSDPIRMPHWCSGSSGVGTFLIRLWLATGEDRHRDLAVAAAHAVRDSRWRMTSTYCHGLAGDGQFLLDLADLLGEPRYHAWAEELATCLHARAAYRAGRLVIPDSSGEITAGYGTGLAGVLSFLLRLRHGGPRPWMTDDDTAAARTVRPSAA